MAPAAMDAASERPTRNGSRKSAAKKDAAKLDPPKQSPQGPLPPDIEDGLEEEFDRFFLRLHEQRDELESNLVSGLNAQKSLEQRHAELQAEHKGLGGELAAVHSEIEKLRDLLAKKEQEEATRRAELDESRELVKLNEAEKKDLRSKFAELEGKLKRKDELVEDANDRARKVVEEKDEALRAAEKRVQKILAYAQTKVIEVVDKNQELLKRLHSAL